MQARLAEHMDYLPEERTGIFTVSVAEACNYTAIMMVREIAEFLDEVPYTKKWKKLEGVTIDKGKILEEGVDILHFLIELFLICGFSADDVYKAFESKHKQNLVRTDWKPSGIKAGRG
jgi:dimeric dUTPase (all-alpha-NTP-PPase superfamily)